MVQFFPSMGRMRWLMGWAQETHKRRSETEMFHTLNFFPLNTSWFLWCCRVWWGENVALGAHFPFPSAPWALQKMTRMTRSLERTFSTSPDNLLSKDTSCFSFVYTVQAVTVSHISGRLFFFAWIFKEFATKHPFNSKRQRETNSGL